MDILLCLTYFQMSFLSVSTELYLMKLEVDGEWTSDSDDAFYVTFHGTEGVQGPVTINEEGDDIPDGRTFEKYVKTEGKVGSIIRLETWKTGTDGLQINTIEVIDAYAPRRWEWTCNCWYDDSWGRTREKDFVSSKPVHTMVYGRFGPVMPHKRLTTAIITTTTFRKCSGLTCTLHCARVAGCTAFNLGTLPGGACVCETLNVETPLPSSYTTFLEDATDFTYYEQKIFQK